VGGAVSGVFAAGEVPSFPSLHRVAAPRSNKTVLLFVLRPACAGIVDELFERFEVRLSRAEERQAEEMRQAEERRIEEMRLAEERRIEEMRHVEERLQATIASVVAGLGFRRVSSSSGSGHAALAAPAASTGSGHIIASLNRHRVSSGRTISEDCAPTGRIDGALEDSGDAVTSPAAEIRPLSAAPAPSAGAEILNAASVSSETVDSCMARPQL
jgi:hypothetical protein